MKCIIIEDEPLAMLRIKDFVGKVPYLQLLATFNNALDAISFLKTEQVDLVFLDVEMDELSGIQLLELLPTRPEVVLSTAFDQYALKGFELNVADYLVKPYPFDRFLQAVVRVQDQLNAAVRREQATYLFVKTEYRLEKVLFDDILYVEGMGDYRRIYLTLAGRDIMTLETFKELERQLPVRQFCRVHKSYIIAFDKIEFIERDRIKINTKMIPVSETYKENFYRLIKQAPR